jgi:hypothetical protein
MAAELLLLVTRQGEPQFVQSYFAFAFAFAFAAVRRRVFFGGRSSWQK